MKIFIVNYLKERVKKFLRRFFLINDTPHKIAAGAALGVFFGIAPGEGLAATLIVSTFLHFNRLAATIGVVAVNMWSTFLVLPLAAWIGALVFGKNYAELVERYSNAGKGFWKLIFSKLTFFDFTLPLFCGFIIVAGAIAFLVYTGLILLIIRYRKHKKSEHLFQKRLEK